MPNKVESSLGDDKLLQFCDELRALSARPTGRQIQEAAERYGFTISIPAALTFRDSTFEAHLQRLRRGKDLAKAITSAVREGEGSALDAAEELAAQELLDVLTDVDAEGRPNIAKLSGVILNLRMAASSRKDTDRKLEETEAKIRNLEQKLELARFDAAKAALQHVKELRMIAGDGTLNEAEKLQRAQLRLFGEAPENLPTLAQLDQRRAAK